MTFDTTPLERDCVLLNCSRPAVDPGRGKVHCTAHDPEPPRPASAAIIGQDPDTQEPVPEMAAPPPLDLAAMEPAWNGAQWVLRVKTVEQREIFHCPHCGKGLLLEAE